ncbi:putative lipoprotein [Pseudomonas coronafaciens pv. atropurpurea]|nr:putative lipoprotein [Pseudomonas coronafaciens pv. atropurpurea]RMT63164.1 putative lipoprotein [Pseudomonas coronafaciens pv. atropurpurea]
MAWPKTPAKKQAFKEAQQKWMALRDVDCRYQAGKPEDSGSMWPLVQAQCLAEHILVRLKQLQVCVACREEDCPR